MCGIFGSVGFGLDLSRCVDSLAYRGPDDAGDFIDRDTQVFLGHRRLAILDLSKAGWQPMALDGASIYITFNGEIYNFQMIKDQHFRSVPFRSKTDTEVILQGYHEFGYHLPELLRGMFAFGIYDKKKGEMFLCRDRLGIKPLYYYSKDGRFAFASELTALKLLPDVNLEIDPLGLDYYFTYGYIPAPFSAYKFIRKLRPAHILVYSIEDKKIRKIAPYWRLRDSIQSVPGCSEREWTEMIRDKLAEAMRLHLISDVPLGAFLSGGLDSSLVVSTMAELVDQPITTFTMGFEFQEYDERIYAESVAKRYGTAHHVEIVSPDAASVLPELVRSFGEPFYDASAIPTYFVSKMARRHVTVALSGDGGDEVFGGYEVYARMHRYAYLERVPLPIRRVMQHLGKHLPKHIPGYGFLQRQAYSDIRLFHEAQCCFPSYDRALLYTEEFKNSLKKEEDGFYRRIIKEEGGFENELITRLQLIDMNSYLPDNVLTKVDRMSMLHSLETRVPLLDHELVELAFSCPASVRFRDRDLKHIVRSLLSGKVSEDVLHHKKHGFAVPLQYWFRKEWKGLMRSLLDETRDDPYVSNQFAGHILDLHQKGGRDFSKYLYTVLFYKAWKAFKT
jgi:asparagine synthase (glutamine-hydrolysing)